MTIQSSTTPDSTTDDAIQTGAPPGHGVVVEDHAGVRTIRLDRPERLNALVPDMVAAITASMAVGPDIRSVVLTGTGRGFCAGVDIQGAAERQAGRSNADGLAMQERFAAMVTAIHRAPVPVIAAINGPAAGAGLAIALASDIRIATDTARLLIGAPMIGLSAGECGISYFLPRLIGLGRAAEVMLTNRPIEAQEALSTGLVTRLVPAGDLVRAATELCEQIGKLAPFGVAMTKQVYHLSADAPSLEQALALENRTQILANATHDAAEARNAFLEKRAPVFTGS